MPTLSDEEIRRRYAMVDKVLARIEKGETSQSASVQVGFSNDQQYHYWKYKKLGVLPRPRKPKTEVIFHSAAKEPEAMPISRKVNRKVMLVIGNPAEVAEFYESIK